MFICCGGVVKLYKYMRNSSNNFTIHYTSRRAQSKSHTGTPTHQQTHQESLVCLSFACPVSLLAIPAQNFLFPSHLSCQWDSKLFLRAVRIPRTYQFHIAVQDLVLYSYKIPLSSTCQNLADCPVYSTFAINKHEL